MGNDIVTILVLFAAAAGLVIYSLIPSSKEARDQLKRRLQGRGQRQESDDLRQRAKVSATASIVRRATPMLSRLVMPVSDQEMTQLRAQLAQAGYRAKNAQTIFLASKTFALILGLVVGGVTAASTGFDLKWTAGIAMGAGAVGFLLPGFWLGSAVKARKDKLRRGLPDILDLMVVSVESGLALDAALKRVGDEMATVHPDLSEEFRIATAETQMGVRRSESLDHLAERCDLDEIRTLVSVISQAERFGTSVGKALRTQGETMRTKRRQKAEEKAQQTAVKLMIPLVLFIFPAMGVVLAGPAAIMMFRNLT